jgi:hypothetical protein
MGKISNLETLYFFYKNKIKMKKLGCMFFAEPGLIPSIPARRNYSISFFRGGDQIKNNISESEILYLKFRKAMPKKIKNRIRKIIFFVS